MDNDAEMRKLLNDLQVGSEVPGLSVEEVTKKYVDVEFKEELENCVTPEERNKKRDAFINHYIVGPGKQFIDSIISQIKYFFKMVKEGIDELKESATQVTASNLVPSVLTVGSATSSPNPAWTVIENSQKKNSLLTIIKTINFYICKMTELAILIHFVLPNSVISVISSLAIITGIINKIPTK